MFSLAPYSLLMRGLTFPIFIWEVQNNLLPMVVGHPSRVVQISNKYIFFHCLFYSAYRIMSKMIIKREQKWLPCSNLSKIFKPKTKILYSHPPIVQNTVKVRFSVCVCVCLCLCVCVCVCVCVCGCIVGEGVSVSHDLHQFFHWNVRSRLKLGLF